MSLFIFLTTEGYTFQPNSESSEPDAAEPCGASATGGSARSQVSITHDKDQLARIENCQVLGFASGADAREAFSNLLSENEYLKETTFDETFAMELANGEKRWFRLKST